MNRLRIILVALPMLVACSKKETRGDAPPPTAPPASVQPAVCSSGGGKVTDPLSVSMLPRRAGNYCLDPNGETRAYGQSARTGIEGVCLEQFDGECELYKGYGLDRLVVARYVEGTAGSGEVSVAVSRFATKEGAYGFFTRRLLGGADPLKATTDPLVAGGAGALGTGMAYVWRGLNVAQLAYSNVSESPEQLKASSSKILPELARTLGTQMPGDLEPPAAASLVPTQGRVKLGIAYEIKDLLGISGLGGGAIGFHQDGERRWRTVVMVRPDEASAKDVLKTLTKQVGARPEKGLLAETVSFSLRPEGTNVRTDWIVARRANTLLGIGDEEFVLMARPGPEQATKVNLPREDKMDRLKAWLTQPASTASAARPTVSGTL